VTFTFSPAVLVGSLVEVEVSVVVVVSAVEAAGGAP
jgi:hypothetical protein